MQWNQEQNGISSRVQTRNIMTRTWPRVCGGGGNVMGRGGGGAIVVRVCEPVFLPHSYTWIWKIRSIHTWSSEMLIYSFTAFWFLYSFIAGCWTNIAVNSLNTKRTSTLEKSLSEKYVHIPGCQKSGAFHIGIQKNRVIHIRFVEKRGPIIYLAALKKGAIQHAHPYYAIYKKLSPTPPSPPPPPPPRSGQ